MGPLLAHKILMVQQGRLFLSILVIFLSVVTGISAFASPVLVNGYVDDVSKERNERFIEVYLLAAPPIREANLQQQIFNAKLSKEFRDRYQEKFGQMDTDSIVYQPTKFSMMDENRGAVENVELKNEERQAFAEYMTKRLSEFHVDNYFKSQPNMRAIYEAKERLQNIKVQVSKQTRFNASYSLAGNILDVIFENPWLDTKLSLEMNPRSFGPSNVEESRVWLGRNISKNLRVNANAALTEGVALIELVRTFKNNLAISGGASGYFRNGSASYLRENGETVFREPRALFGLTHFY